MDNIYLSGGRFFCILQAVSQVDFFSTQLYVICIYSQYRLEGREMIDRAKSKIDNNIKLSSYPDH